MIDSIGTYDYIPLSAIVSKAKFKVGLRDTNDYDIHFEDAALTAYKRLRVINGNMAEVQLILPINDNFVAELPKGFIRFNRNFPIRFVNDNGTSFREFGNTPAVSGETFYTGDPEPNSPSGNGGRVGVQQIGNSLYFDSDPPTNYIMIAALVQLRDSLGNIMIPSLFEEFMAPYAAYEWCLANNDPRWQIFKEEYKVNRRAVKGIIKQTSALDYTLAAYNMSSLI